MSIGSENHLTIVVIGGFVDAVFTTLKAETEVCILDFDGAKQDAPEAFGDMSMQLEKIKRDQKQIY